MSPTDSYNSENKQENLGTRVAIGVVWLVAIKWATQFLGLISTLVLARLLIPEDFGIVALATAYVAVVEGLTLLPMNQALIKFREPDRSFYDTAWSLSVIRGLLIALAMISSAIPVSALIGEGRLESVIAVLAFLPLISGLQNPRFIDFEKALVFSKSFILQVSTRFAMVAVTICIAIVLRTYWAIIIGTLVSALVQVGVGYALSPYRPRFTLKQFRALFGFSAWLWGTSFVRTLNMQADKFAVGGLLGTSAVGVYYLGITLSRTLIGSLNNSLVRALYPGFTLIADDQKKLRKNVLEASAILVAVTLPLGVGFALVAEEFVNLLLGSKWIETIPIIRVLVPILALSSLVTVTDPVVMARGKTKLMFYRACIMFVVRLGAVIPGVIYFGLLGAVYGWALSHLVYLASQLFLLGRILDIPTYWPLVRAWRSGVSLICMVLCVLVVNYIFSSPGSTFELALAMAIKIAVGGASYCMVHGTLWILAGCPTGAESRIVNLAKVFLLKVTN